MSPEPTMALWILRVVAALYTVAAVFAIVQAFKPTGEKKRGKVLMLLGIALGGHMVQMAFRASETGTLPIMNTHDGVSFFTFMLAVLALAVAWKGGVPQVAILTAPLAAVLVAILSVTEPGPPMALKSVWLWVHIGLALLGDAAFAVAGIVSIVYLIQERRLKTKKPMKSSTGLHDLPSLEILDKVSVMLFKWGFPMMTFGLLTGVLYGKQVLGQYWTWDPRNTLSLMVWLLYAVMLYARLMIGWRGRKAAILTLVGVVAILVASVGLGLAGVGIHGKDYVS